MPAALATMDLLEYLRYCGGSDILIFDESSDASAAAWSIRRQVGEHAVEIRASYNKLHLRLRR